MFWLAVIAVALAALFLWLKQITVQEKTINTSTSARMNELLDFLCCPVNLEKYHPYVQKVTDVQETKEFVNFRMEENLGMGAKKVVSPMSLKKYRDSQVTAMLRLENSSKFANVTLTLSITDDTQAMPHIKDTLENNVSSRIQLLVHVEAPRFLNFFIPSHLVEAWTIALDKTKSILEH